MLIAMSSSFGCVGLVAHLGIPEVEDELLEAQGARSGLRVRRCDEPGAGDDRGSCRISAGSRCPTSRSSCSLSGSRALSSRANKRRTRSWRAR